MERRDEQCIGGGCRRFITTNTMEGGAGMSKGGHGGRTGIGATDFLYMRLLCKNSQMDDFYVLLVIST